MKFTDAVRATLTGYFNAHDVPTEAQFTALILAIQEGIEEHDHSGTGDGDGANNLVGPVGIGGAPSEEFDVIQTAGNIIQVLRSHSATAGHYPGLFFRKSHHNTIGTEVATINGEVLGDIRFYGVDTGPGWAFGARMKVTQVGAAAANFVEADWVLFTHSTTGANTNQLYLDGGTGYVGVGSIPIYNFEVVGNRASYVTRFFNDGGDGHLGIMIQCGEDADPDEIFAVFKDGDGDSVGFIVGDGAGGVTYHSLSDIRHKKPIGTINPNLALEALSNVNPIQYVGKRRATGRKNVGFSAQDILPYFPEVVHLDEETGFYSMSYERLTPILWAQNQALLKRIEQLEAK